jgi:transcriptional regulator with XRE-family HTH domain
MGLTQAQLAKRIGCNNGSICRYESGKRPRLPMAERVAVAVGLTVADLWPTLDRAVKKGRLLDTVIPIETATRKRGIPRTHGMRLAYSDPDGGHAVHHEHRPPICCGCIFCRVVDLNDPETYRVVGEPTRIAAGGANA